MLGVSNMLSGIDGENGDFTAMAQFQVPAVQQMERHVWDRRETDFTLPNWALCFFVLSWATLGIYPIILFYKRIDRADLFRNRKAGYYRATIEFSRQYAAEIDRTDEVHSQIEDLNAYIEYRLNTVHTPINAGLSLVLSVVTFGIYGLLRDLSTYEFWWEIQITEREFL